MTTDRARASMSAGAIFVLDDFFAVQQRRASL
jgi:hypothetical protein